MSNIQVFMLRVSHYTMVNYCYIIADLQTKDAVIIDPAWDIQTIETELNRLHLNARAVLLTHHHFDHVHLAAILQKHYGFPFIYLSKKLIFITIHVQTSTLSNLSNL